ncbi:hypothetical protein UlMin_008029 [Ulmus minor]
MSENLHELELKGGNLVYPSPLTPPSPNPSSSSLRISPVLLLVIVTLTVIFFISGLVHLLLRFFMKRPSSLPIYQSNRFQETSGSHALQRQLRQLFRLHDSGLDQAVIDALPVFYYKDIMGLKEPFDCAVCLCEFSDQDELRLLPGCSHAFHIHCIDTWLLSNSTCPLCRRTLLSSDIFLESPNFNFDDSREMPSGFLSDGENIHSISSNLRPVAMEESVGGKRVFSVRLGKFKSLVGEQESTEKVGESSSCNLDARRCFSMGTFQYVVGDSDLQVALCQDRCGFSGRNTDFKLVREGSHLGNSSIIGDSEGKKISSRQKGESFSVSKIWLWPKKSRFPSSYNTDISLPTSLDVRFPSNSETQTT